MIIVDTGPLYAAADTSDDHHHTCADLFEHATDRLLVPITVVVETSYLIERHLGATAEAAFLRSLTPAGLTIGQLTEHDLERTAELVTTYADLPLGAVDASIVALAERHHITTLLTLDHRHFTIVRPDHTPSFTLRP